VSTEENPPTTGVKPTIIQYLNSIDNDWVSVRWLSKHLGLSKQGVGRTLQRMVNRGEAEFHPSWVPGTSKLYRLVSAQKETD
jgi:DNA-binding IclR family transcriptional regulator